MFRSWVQPICVAVLLVACSDEESTDDASTSSTAVTGGPTSSSGSAADGGDGGGLATTATSAGGSAPSSGSGGGGAGGSAGPGGGDTGGAGGSPPSCTLTESGPVVATADGQVFENLHIVATAGDAVVINGFHDVVVRNCSIEHAGGVGIRFSNANGLLVSNVDVVHTGAPEAGANASAELNNINGYASPDVVIDHVRLARGSSGIYLAESPAASLSFVEGHDFRGPFPRGQLVQFNNCDDSTLEDFSVINPRDTSWPEDNVNVYQSTGVEIRRGLVDGNNSPSGVGVIFDGDEALGSVEDVDAVRMGNGCFSDYAGSDGVVFRRTRCRENICEDQGRGEPSSNALMFCGHPGYSEIRLEDSTWFDSCNGNLIWPSDSFAVIELIEEDFTPRDPIALSFCWE